MSKHSGSTRAKRSLGQNFLSDSASINRIIDAVAPGENDLIFEIGPGRGALTERLVASGARVVAIEIDRELIQPLMKEFGGSANFHLIEQDALTVDFPKLFAELNCEIAYLRSVKLAANLPYYISTAILQRLAEQREFFASLVLMFQREVVERITAAPGNSHRGFLTVLAESSFEIERLFDIPPTAFRPAPKISSSVVRLVPKPGRAGEDKLRNLASAGFAQKRKTIANNLKSAFPNSASALAEAGVDPGRRAETLTLEEWQRLTSAVFSG